MQRGVCHGKKLPNISESEWLIMNKLWEASPQTAAEIVEKVQQEKELEMTTIKTLLRRLIAKKAVSFTIDPKNSKLYYYSPIVEQHDCVMEKSKQFLSLYYENNLNKLFANFLEDAILRLINCFSVKINTSQTKFKQIANNQNKCQGIRGNCPKIERSPSIMEKKGIVGKIAEGLVESTRNIHKINKENITAVSADSKANFEAATLPDFGLKKFIQADGLGNKVKVVIENIKEGARENSEREKVQLAEIQSHSSYNTLLAEQRKKRQNTSRPQ